MSQTTRHSESAIFFRGLISRKKLTGLLEVDERLPGLLPGPAGGMPIGMERSAQGLVRSLDVLVGRVEGDVEDGVRIAWGGEGGAVGVFLPLPSLLWGRDPRLPCRCCRSCGSPSLPPVPSDVGREMSISSAFLGHERGEKPIRQINQSAVRGKWTRNVLIAQTSKPHNVCIYAYISIYTCHRV